MCDGAASSEKHEAPLDAQNIFWVGSEAPLTPEELLQAVCTAVHIGLQLQEHHAYDKKKAQKMQAQHSAAQ